MSKKMRIIGFLVAAIGLGIVFAAALEDESTAQTAEPTLQPNDQAMVAQGLKIYGQYCAACHGAGLEGQPNWRRPGPDGRLPAPPHDASGHTWHHPDRQLFALTKLGPGGIVAGYQSNMLGFDGVLSDQEIVAVLSYIKSTWPGDIRTRHDQINANFKARQR